MTANSYILWDDMPEKHEKAGETRKGFVCAMWGEALPGQCCQVRIPFGFAIKIKTFRGTGGKKKEHSPFVFGEHSHNESQT